jgi:hypothetical protein
MIQLITQCGIGLLVGCVLTLAFFPLMRRSAGHSTKRELAAVTPLIAGDIQAEKDQMRAEFVMSVRRLEIGMERMREKAMARLGPADKRTAEINHLHAELDKKAALIVALRAQAEWHKTVARKVVKVLLYIFARMRRRQRTAVVAPPLFKFEQGPQWQFKKQPVQRGYASAPTPIAAKTQPVRADLAAATTFAAKAHPVPNDVGVAAPPIPAKAHPVQSDRAVAAPAMPVKTLAVQNDRAVAASAMPAEARPVQNGRAVAAPAIPAKVQPAQNGPAITARPLAPKAQPPQSDLAATAAAIAAVNLKRRRAISNKV